MFGMKRRLSVPILNKDIGTVLIAVTARHQHGRGCHQHGYGMQADGDELG